MKRWFLWQWVYIWSGEMAETPSGWRFSSYCANRRCHELGCACAFDFDQIIFNSFFSSLTKKNGKQYGEFLRDLNRDPSSASWSLPQAWLLHCRVLDMLGVDYLRLHPRDNLCALRDRVPEPWRGDSGLQYSTQLSLRLSVGPSNMSFTWNCLLM